MPLTEKRDSYFLCVEFADKILTSAVLKRRLLERRETGAIISIVFGQT